MAREQVEDIDKYLDSLTTWRRWDKKLDLIQGSDDDDIAVNTSILLLLLMSWQCGAHVPSYRPDVLTSAAMALEKPLVELTFGMNITTAEARMFGGVVIASGITILAASGSMIVYTFITPSPDNMKTCEKLIVYNVLAPDLLLGALLTQILGPAIINRSWNYSRFFTQWLAFLHAGCVYHAHVAAGFICYIIAMSLRDVYRYEGSHDTKHMSALVVSSLSLTICFCSLPATERQGYVYMETWLGPWFNIRYQYAGYFMVLAMTGLILHLDITSIVKLFGVKKVFTQEGSKVTRRALDDLNKVIIYAIITTLCALLTLPAMFVVKSKIAVLFVRLLLYVGPLVRVVILLYLCPHFQFGRSVVTTHDMDDFAKLGEETGDTTSDKLASIIGDEEGGDT